MLRRRNVRCGRDANQDMYEESNKERTRSEACALKYEQQGRRRRMPPNQYHECARHDEQATAAAAEKIRMTIGPLFDEAEIERRYESGWYVIFVLSAGD